MDMTTPNAPVDAVHSRRRGCRTVVVSRGTGIVDVRRTSRVKRGRAMLTRMIRDWSEGWVTMQSARAVRVPPDIPKKASAA
jgi:hypothetical protein